MTALVVGCLVAASISGAIAYWLGYRSGVVDGVLAERKRRRLADAAVQVAHHLALGDRARYEGPSR